MAMGIKRRHKDVALLGLLLSILLVFYKLFSDLSAPKLVTKHAKMKIRDFKNDNHDTLKKSSDDKDDRFVHDVVIDVNRTSQYCNSPFIPIKGTEGSGPFGFKLRMVHVFIRHGDRTAMHTLPGYRKLKYDCHFDNWYRLNGNDEVFRMFENNMKRVTRRNTNVYRFQTYSLHPNDNICKDQSLTSRGTLQHLQIGRHLNERYVVQNDMFDRKLPMMSQVHVRSTVTERTFQSAVAFMFGFLPDYNISDLLFTPAHNFYMCTHTFQNICSCDAADVLRHNVKRYEGSRSCNEGSRCANLKNKIAENFGIKTNEIPGFDSVLDVVIPQVCHEKGNPCSDQTGKTRCLNDKLLRRLWLELIEAKNSHTRDPDMNMLKFSRIMMYPVFKEISDRMQNFTEGRYTDTFVLYSGHDLTLTSMLYALGISDGMWPPYASRLIFEMYDTDLDPMKQKAYLRILYNGHDVTKDVIFCKGHTYKGVCSLERFSYFIGSRMLLKFGYNSYKDACSTTDG